MANEGTIVIPRMTRYERRLLDAMYGEMIPLRILCPGCHRDFFLFIKDFDQGIYCIIGQSCPYCKRFITERDDPTKLLADRDEIIKEMGGEDIFERGK